MVGLLFPSLRSKKNYTVVNCPDYWVILFKLGKCYCCFTQRNICYVSSFILFLYSLYFLHVNITAETLDFNSYRNVAYFFAAIVNLNGCRYKNIKEFM